tara:strand:+ start:369 stop:584 length:216 start_codon:yes stop_codon:yes gene_type:complete
MDEQQIQDELMEVSWQIIDKLDNPDLELSEEQKSDLHMGNDTMMFFIEQENWDRALKEGQNNLNKLNNLTE